MNWTDIHAHALAAVFEELRASGLKWMVLRNYEGLPSRNRAKDIDLLLHKSDFRAAYECIAAALSVHEFHLSCEVQYQYASCYTFFKLSEGETLSLKIDLLDGFSWRGAQIVGFAEIYSRRVSSNGLDVPHPVHDGFMLWTKPLMTGGFVKDAYRGDIARAVKDHPLDFRALLINTFGKALAETAWADLLEGRLDRTTEYKSTLRRSAWLRAFSRRPVSTTKESINHVLSELSRRKRRPKGSMIAVVGPDGAGKTTFIELLQRELIRCLVKDARDVRVIHFRPRILPNIKRLILGNKFDEHAENFSNPHRAAPAGLLSSLLRQTYYWFDYVIGYWARIRRQCVSGKVIIFDRYCYDFFVDPRRSRIQLPAVVRLAFLRLIPQPDIVFFLQTDAQTIFTRKSELTLHEIERQLVAYRQLAAASSRFVTLDANQTPQDLSRSAVQQLLEKSFAS